MKRYGVNKHRAARRFKGSVQRTRSANIWTGPMRGGIRL